MAPLEGAALKEGIMRMAWLLGYSLCVLTACVQTHFYEPTLTLEPSPATIPATVRMERLKNVSPLQESQSENVVFGKGIAMTDPRYTKGDLTELIGQAIYDDFKTNRVFSVIEWTAEDPDLILAGTIYHFYEWYDLPWWQSAPFINLVTMIGGAPIERFQGDVDLELRLSRQNGEIVRQYRARVPIDERIALYDADAWRSRTKFSEFYGFYLNRAFTAAVRQLRDQLTRDPALAIAVR